MKTKILQLHPSCDYTPLSQERDNFVARAVGYDQQLYWLQTLQQPDYRYIAENGCSFAKITPDNPPTYRIQAFAGNTMTLDITLANIPMNIHMVQPLPNNELLLVCGRSEYRGKDDFDKNAFVYSREGVFLRSFLLGDGINHVQTTARGIVWVAYFDEGVYGNYGWGRAFDLDTGKRIGEVEPVGRDGLLVWNAKGRVLYRFRPTEAMMALDMWGIDDCYALNVASVSDTWLYYYASFPLVQLHNRKIVNYWQVPMRGSGVFAVAKGHALFGGGYKQEEHGLYTLLTLGACGSKARRKACFRLLDEHAEPLVPDQTENRGNTLYLFKGRKLYLLTVEQALLL